MGDYGLDIRQLVTVSHLLCLGVESLWTTFAVGMHTAGDSLGKDGTS